MAFGEILSGPPISSKRVLDEIRPEGTLDSVAAVPPAAVDVKDLTQYIGSQEARFDLVRDYDARRARQRAGEYAAKATERYEQKVAAFEAYAWACLEARAESRATKHEQDGSARRRKRATTGNGASTRTRGKRQRLESPETRGATASGTDVEPAVPDTSALHATNRSVTSSMRASSPQVAQRAPQQQAPPSNQVFVDIWKEISRKDVPKAHKIYQSAQAVKISNARKTATLAAKEARKYQVKTNKHLKDLQSRGRRAMREMMAFWKRNEKEERDSRKKAEKEAVEQAKKEEEERESKRQARKLNFLITQTELYTHFVSSKVSKATGASPSEQSTDMKDIDFDGDNESELQKAAEANAERAAAAAKARTKQFDEDDEGFQNPTSLGDETLPQPQMLTCQLKEYQLKGLTWLANLYEQGINGILADEMGLGKTVQSISVMAYLAETHDIWGPFIVIAPASTLHNWQQEITKFVPEFKVLPYWGSGKDRKVLRKFWDRRQLRYTRDSPFHVLVTNYQLVVSDAQYLNRIRWQYMILDEAQAIKSSSSSRWKSLLGMQCRNRLLLTGTPIQNSMQELWALLHFIMPTLFDSHEEFSDWFSKDIESHATKNSQLNEAQLKRLHLILKPFMLRRIKSNVQQELGDKIEVDVYCQLTRRQLSLYQQLRSQIKLQDLLSDDAQSLMNLVMQFRKVCNHPDLFERSDVESSFAFCSFPVSAGARESKEVAYAARNPIEFDLPKLVYRSELENPLIRRLTVWKPHLRQTESFLVDKSASELCRIAHTDLLSLAERQYEPRSSLQIVDPPRQWLEFAKPAATAPPVTVLCSDRSHAIHQQRLSPPKSLWELSLDEEWYYYKNDKPFPPHGLLPESPHGFAPITMPSMIRFITDSGKLSALDTLLTDLKRNGHKVLIYFQMTRMMDLMEDYLTFRQYKYLRLDGSSRLGDRRDLVNDWQTKPELFVFLLSTRAGGLGINLTAADTVIFYDSDWNPTIDSQAMDRAHRLGQTRQVTVYRLLVKGTIEERMRDRAKQKEHVQQVVMEGTNRGKAPGVSKPGREVAYWLLDDDKAVEELQKQQAALEKEKGRKPKRQAASNGK